MCHLGRRMLGHHSEVPWIPTLRSRAPNRHHSSKNEIHLFNGRGFKLPNFHSYYFNTPRTAGYSSTAERTILVKIRFIHYHVLISTSFTNQYFYPHRPGKLINEALSSLKKLPHISSWLGTIRKNSELHSFPLSNISSHQNIKQEISNFTQFISTTVFECSSAISLTNPKQDIPQYILREIAWKRCLHSRWQRTRDPLIKFRLNFQTSHVRNLISSHRKNEWFNVLGSLQTDLGGYSFYKINRKLLRKRFCSYQLPNVNTRLITSCLTPG